MRHQRSYYGNVRSFLHVYPLGKNVAFFRNKKTFNLSITGGVLVLIDLSLLHIYSIVFPICGTLSLINLPNEST